MMEIGWRIRLTRVCFAKVTLHDMNEEQNPQAESPSAAPIPATVEVLLDPVIDAAPAFNVRDEMAPSVLRQQIEEACRAWLSRSPSAETRTAYSRELFQFLRFISVPPGAWERLVAVRPNQVAAWRDELLLAGQSNAAVNRKLTVLRSFFSFLRTYGYLGANPADPAFVASPAVPRDGKTVALTPEDCRRILDAADAATPEGTRDRALFAVLAYTGCRVGELCRLRVADLKATGGHRVLEIRGKGGKERRVPLHAEAVERLEIWIHRAGLHDAGLAPLFRPTITARGRGHDGFLDRALSRRSVQYLIARYVKRLGLDPNITVHSFRATALTTARERGADIVDLQDFAGHSDPRTTLAYIRNRDRLSRSPAYVLRY
jgi:integrase/recombinase XerD